MANTKSFQCQLITPEAALLDAVATSVVMTAHDGEIGALRDRAPLLCKLGIGECRVATEQGLKRFYVEGGFAQVLDNQVVVLTPKATATSDLQPEQAQKELAEWRSKSTTSEEQRQVRELHIQRARTKIKLAVKR